MVASTTDNQVSQKLPTVEEQQRAKLIINRYDRLKNNRSTLDSHLQEVAERVVPRKAHITTKHREGTKVKDIISELFDVTAVFANQDMGAGVVSHLFPANSQWFGLKAANDELNNRPSVRESLAKMTTLIHEEFAVSNFNNIINEVVNDMGWAGQALIEPKPGKETALTFKASHPGEFVIAENSDGVVDTIYYKFKFTARQAKQEWGEQNLSKSILEALHSTDMRKLDDEFEFIQELKPREEFDKYPAVVSRRPIGSVFVCVKDKSIVFEDGFYEMPKLTPRWHKNSDEVNGRSQAMLALPWIKLINKIVQNWMHSVELGNRPPTLVPDDGFVSTIRWIPGALWSYRASYAANPNAIRQLQIGSKISDTKDMMVWAIDSIKKAFYNDLFVLLAEDEGKRTAYEIAQKIEEKYSRIVPPIGRLQTELANGLITRCIGILGRAGKFRGIMAPELIGQPYKIQYVSKLALAIKYIEVKSVVNTLEIVNDTIGQRNPQVFDNFDDDATARGIADRMGMPPDMINDPEKVEEIREARAQLMEAQQAAEAAAGVADAVPKLQKKTEDDSPLAQLAELAKIEEAA